VLTSSGEVLTNNHVIDGSTSISVTVVSTGNTYTAKVVGTDPTDDVAVLQLQNASGLATAKIGDSSAVRVGSTVTAVGNAGGAGGVPSSAAGTVIALNQTITASDQNGSNPETLTGMIELNADIQAGDSGGPLYTSDGTIVGIDTAGSTSQASATTTGFAIPIAKATSIAEQIESGKASSTIHRGYPAFLGVQLDPASGYGSVGGAAIAGVVAGSAAAHAGLQAGDAITTLNGTAIAGPTDLSSALAGLKPGQQVRVGWVDSAGQSHSATVTLGTGPAD
jgi:S1-C subfamily serine protease